MALGRVHSSLSLGFLIWNGRVFFSRMWCECQILYEKCQTEQGAPGMSASARPQLLKPSAPQAKIHLFNKHRRGPEPQARAPLGNPDILPGHLTGSHRPLSPPALLPHAFPGGVAPPPAAAQAGSSPPGHPAAVWDTSGACAVGPLLSLPRPAMAGCSLCFLHGHSTGVRSW